MDGTNKADFELLSSIHVVHFPEVKGLISIMSELKDVIASKYLLILQPAFTFVEENLLEIINHSQSHLVVSLSNKEYCNDLCVFFNTHQIYKIFSKVSTYLVFGYGVHLTELLIQHKLSYALLPYKEPVLELPLSNYTQQQISNILSCILKTTQSSLQIQEKWYQPRTEKVSIILLIWNKLKISIDCIKSIIKNTRHPYELIIIDNDSEEPVQKWCRKYLRNQKNIVFHRNKENQGFAQGCNQAITFATGEHILLLNNDTIVTPFWLTRMVASFVYKNVGIVSPMSINVGGEQNIDKIFSLDHKPYIDNKELLKFSEKFSISRLGTFSYEKLLFGFSMLIRKEVWQKIGGLDPIYGYGYSEDADYCMRTLRLGYELFLCKDIYIDHVGSASFNSVSFNKEQLYLQNLIYTHFKHLEYDIVIALSDEVKDCVDTHRKKRVLWYNLWRETLQKHDIIPLQISDCLQEYPVIHHPFLKEETLLAYPSPKENSWVTSVHKMILQNWNVILRVEPPVPFQRDLIQNMISELPQNVRDKIYIDMEYFHTIERGAIYSRVSGVLYLPKFDFFRFKREINALNIPIYYVE